MYKRQDKWEPSDEYLSGNVREKLHIARQFTENHPEYMVNVCLLYTSEAKDTENLSDALMATAKYMVEENLEEYLDGLLYMTEGTYLEDVYKRQIMRKHSHRAAAVQHF